MKRSPARRNEPLPMPSFTARLQEGEQILWQGQPDLRLFVWPKVIGGSLLALPLLPPIIWLESWRRGTPPAWTSAPTLIICVLTWVGVTAYLRQQAREQTRAAAYALTNRRIFIRRLERLTSQDWRLKVDEIPLTRVRPGLRILGGGRGTITLGTRLWEYEKALRGIAGAAEVFAQLTEARAALAGLESEGPYYAKTNMAQPDVAWTLGSLLRRGETILWQGQMDAATDARSGHWIVPIRALVLAAVGGGILSLFAGWTWPWQALILAASFAVVLPVARSDARTPGKRPEYALTDRRVLVIHNPQHRQPNVEERELPETADMRLVPGRDGYGTVIFEKKTRFVWHGQSGTVETYEFSFKHIADAKAVFAQVRAAHAGYR